MNRPLSALRATLVIARLTRMRLWRGKLLRIAAVLALAPVVAVALAAPDADKWIGLYHALTVLMIVIPALLLAPWMSEEVDDRTYTYLWSRPLPRHAVMLGKFLAMVPVALALCLATVGTCFALMFGSGMADHTDTLLGSLLGIGGGAIAWSATAVGIGSVVPRYATAVVIVYFMFLDTALGSIPFAMQNLATSHHVRHIMSALAEGQEGVVSSVLWLVFISAIWLGVAAWRVTVSEYTSDS